jgi:hypothetical protein
MKKMFSRGEAKAPSKEFRGFAAWCENIPQHYEGYAS